MNKEQAKNKTPKVITGRKKDGPRVIEYAIKSHANHRNGIGGEPFVQVHFSYEILNGDGEKGSNMLATIGYEYLAQGEVVHLCDRECRVTNLDNLEAQHRGEWFASFLIPHLDKIYGS